MNIYTIDEANRKFCPMSIAPKFTGTTKYVAVNRMHDGRVASSCLCVGSKCMMWRWSEEEKQKGYCGLAEK